MNQNYQSIRPGALPRTIALIPISKNDSLWILS